MEISSGFLIVGLLMTFAGAVLIYQSLKVNPDETKTRTEGVVFVGPIPIIISGTRKWIVAAIGVTGIILAWLMTSSMNLGLLGWL